MAWYGNDENLFGKLFQPPSRVELQVYWGRTKYVMALISLPRQKFKTFMCSVWAVWKRGGLRGSSCREGTHISMHASILPGYTCVFLEEVLLWRWVHKYREKERVCTEDDGSLEDCIRSKVMLNGVKIGWMCTQTGTGDFSDNFDRIFFKILHQYIHRNIHESKTSLILLERFLLNPREQCSQIIILLIYSPLRYINRFLLYSNSSSFGGRSCKGTVLANQRSRERIRDKWELFSLCWILNLTIDRHILNLITFSYTPCWSYWVVVVIYLEQDLPFELLLFFKLKHTANNKSIARKNVNKPKKTHWIGDNMFSGGRSPEEWGRYTVLKLQ